MPRIRNSLGKFTKNYCDDNGVANYYKHTDEPGFLYKEIRLKMPALSIINIIKFVFLIFLISPWVYIFIKKGNLNQLSGQIRSYYDDQFTISNEMCNTTDGSFRKSKL